MAKTKVFCEDEDVRGSPAKGNGITPNGIEDVARGEIVFG